MHGYYRTVVPGTLFTGAARRGFRSAAQSGATRSAEPGGNENAALPPGGARPTGRGQTPASALPSATIAARIRYFCTLPVMVIGKPSTKRT